MGYKRIDQKTACEMSMVVAKNSAFLSSINAVINVGKPFVSILGITLSNNRLQSKKYKK